MQASKSPTWTTLSPLPAWISTSSRIIVGTVVAIACLETGLRVFTTPGPAPRPDVLRDSFEAPTFERRQIEEGIATSHFSLFGARLTGNPPLRAAAPTLILGDSYVEAEQVRDNDTMGAWLERLARANGVPLDVRQFGWLGASPAQYLLVAGDLRNRWDPSQVFIVLSANDFDNSALVLAHPSLRVSTAGEVRIIGGAIPPISGKPPRGSALMTLVRHRWELVERRLAARPTGGGSPALEGERASSPADAPPDSLEYARAPAAIVRALSAAYGPSLTLVFLAEVRLNGDDTAPGIEVAFDAACTQWKVRCVSTRPAMRAAYRAGHVGHGAGIAVLGNGHLNAIGHEVVGRMMWQAMQAKRDADRRHGP